MFNIFLVMVSFLLYQKLILHKNEKLQLILTVNQYHLMRNQVMIEPITADSDSSEASDFEDTLCKLETSATEIEATLNQIATGL